MKFVAPEQAPEQAEIIRNTPFWPDVDLSEFRCVMRTDGTVTQPRLKQVALALLIAAMVYPQGIFPVLAASGVWVACLLTWAVIPVALAALIKNGPLWQELRASLLKTITRKENVFISWVMRLLIVVSLAWTGWAITLVFYLLTVIAFWITRNQMAQQVAA
ncbi:DNZ54_00345 family protein [Escherichia coli]|uniref:DNZ54_00345 family protein n=5 Tax=Enterobacteriaceae TaxID=543 RepID=UPI0037DCC614